MLTTSTAAAWDYGNKNLGSTWKFPKVVLISEIRVFRHLRLLTTTAGIQLVTDDHERTIS
jgi:hypothetical protein